VNASIEEFYPATTQLDVSMVRGFTDANNGNKQIRMGQHPPNGTGLLIQNYTVSNETVSFAAGNWNATSTGRLNVEPTFWGNWTVQ
jgi:glyoxylate carboligase